jgi:hypothetical protein
LIAGASLCAITSALLFVFKPVPPIGLVAAIGVALEAVGLLFVLFFPRQVKRMQRSGKRALEKEPRTNIGQWVP